MARTAGQVSARRGVFAQGRMLGAALIVVLGPVADVLPSAAQYAPAAPAQQQQPFPPFAPFPSITPAPAEAPRPVTRPVQRTQVKPRVARPHPSRQKVGEKKTSRRKLSESNETQRETAARKTSRKKVPETKENRRKITESKGRRRKPSESQVNQREVAEGKGYKRLSDLVNFPNFFPGLGIIFVKPDTMPTGPYLCFDREDHLVATVYMIAVKDIDDHKTLEAAGVSAPVDHVSFYFNPGHPGMDMPHYHFVIWHVPKKEEARVAQ